MKKENGFLSKLCKWMIYKLEVRNGIKICNSNLEKISINDLKGHF